MTLGEEELSYIAGYLDGEGCFTTVGKYCKPTVACATTHRPTIKWLHDLFGGSFGVAKGKKANHRPTFHWRVVGRAAARVCMIVAPFLKEKQRQAALLIAIQALSNCPKIGNRVDPDAKSERERLAMMNKLAKGRIHE